ncbi:3-dehydroquinate synthase II/3-amino-4-hydroxybenzoic acid synthase [Stigmatella aurantiaca]|uniref:3-dehydroquinate synthase II/3-amino-4-hydroxybenzoic acid synthase n=1 Tax=Stigmatella aurantiaca TaxID=41 RepID=A0A1H7Q3V8_STIAU|nr:3-dehydroquinate synthase II [Stigmatella aurantiaca]SEL42821.1 3-dehydroquinate synthase II/3-amino-4-hydroxybenzoic acid synthase [Stigmatella aurantiaca]
MNGLNMNEVSTMEKRERIRLERIEGDRNRIEETNSLIVWFDTAGLSTPNDGEGMLERIVNLEYTGAVLYPDNVATLAPVLPARMLKVYSIQQLEDLERLRSMPQAGQEFIVASMNASVLEKAATQGFKTCYRAYVDDGASLHQSIQEGVHHAYLMVRFRDPTNIPLELVIASLQATRTVLIKEINSPQDVDDAIVTLGVMEVGAEGVMFSPRSHEVLSQFVSRLANLNRAQVKIESSTIVRSVPIGMGYRSCIDTSTLFSPTEGMLVGSTSQGGLLCCPEVFFLPYMELRPFRVNAGAVHSYVYNFGNRTDYMSELRAGSPVMLVDRSGNARRAAVGRMKTEVRPLRLIEAEFQSGERINTIMQDDWHVRIFSDDAKPLNITELRPGDKVLGHVAKPGRHVGIKVDEHIIES